MKSRRRIVHEYHLDRVDRAPICGGISDFFTPKIRSLAGDVNRDLFGGICVAVNNFSIVDRSLWMLLTIAGFSISGFPLLSGFGTKVLTMKNLLPRQEIVMNMVMVGTAIAVAKFRSGFGGLYRYSADDRYRLSYTVYQSQVPSARWRSYLDCC